MSWRVRVKRLFRLFFQIHEKTLARPPQKQGPPGSKPQGLHVRGGQEVRQVRVPGRYPGQDVPPGLGAVHGFEHAVQGQGAHGRRASLPGLAALVDEQRGLWV